MENLPIIHVNKEINLVLNETFYVVCFEINLITVLGVRFSQS